MHSAAPKPAFDLKPLLPLIKLRQAKNWATIGFKTLSALEQGSLLQLFGADALQQRDILNDFYAEVVESRLDSVQTSVSLVESLLRLGGLNHLTVDYYFAILTLAHSFSLNREEVQEAIQVEHYMSCYLAINKNKSQTAQTWLCKLERLMHE